MAQQWTEQLGSARLREPWGVAMFGEVSPDDLEHAPKRLRIVGVLALIAGAAGSTC